MAQTSAPRVPLSILDLVSVSEGESVPQAIDNSMRAAILADELGYARFFFAENHNTPAVASSATALLIAQAAGLTSRIRVGSAGVMLPNHSPLVIAEQFGTLVNSYGPRIDLGLGRAPGTDHLTASKMHRGDSDPSSFAHQIIEMQGYFSDAGKAPNEPVHAVVAQGTRVPMLVLGSSVNGAAIAAELGLPFAFAAHFAPADLLRAINFYRDHFKPNSPTAQITEPYVALGVNVMVAETTAEAEYQFTTVEQMFAGINTGRRAPIPPPVHDLEAVIGDQLSALSRRSLSIKAVGDPASVVAQLEDYVSVTGVDELITVSYAHDSEVRLNSLRLLAEAWGIAS
ncbi:MAG: LLM class flavin-dependent oxidoreductase [Microbacteriaceae bacterium]